MPPRAVARAKAEESSDDEESRRQSINLFLIGSFHMTNLRPVLHCQVNAFISSMLASKITWSFFVCIGN